MNTLNKQTYVISNIHLEEAKQIVRWQYEAPYTRYNMSDDLDDIEELMDGSYYAVKSLDNELIGFFCNGTNAQIGYGAELGLYDDDAIDIGVGMRPDLTGQGKGREFFLAGLKFFMKLYAPQKFRLSVAAFNTRAISLYSHVGFSEIAKFTNKVNDQETVFIVMVCETSLMRLML